MDTNSQKNQPKTINGTIDKHRQDYKKYLHGIYESIKEKDYYIHRAHTPKMETFNRNNLSNFSEKQNKINNQQKGKSLPKIMAKEVLSDDLIQMLGFSPQERLNQQQKKSNSFHQPPNSPQKQVYKGQTAKYKNPYRFQSFHQSNKKKNNKVGNQSKELRVKVKDALIERQEKIPKQQKNNQIKKINKVNMNLLGLNVQKVKYSEKKDCRKNLFKNSCDFQQQQENTKVFSPSKINQKNPKQPVNIFMNPVVCASIKYASEEVSEINLDICQELISQKMNFSKRNLQNGQRVGNPLYSPAKFKRRIVSSEKKSPSPGPENQQLNPIYQGRYNKYLQLILKLSYTYKIYGQMDESIDPKKHSIIKNEKKYKAWVGSGNNGNLLKALLKRRFWWQVVEEKNWNCNFIWTQLKNNQYFNAQRQALKTKKQQEIENKMSQSTSLSVDEENVRGSTKKENNFERNRAYSSLAGSLQKSKKQNSIYPTKNRKIAEKTGEKECSKHLRKILNSQEEKTYSSYLEKLTPKMSFKQKLKKMGVTFFNPYECKVHNHLMNSFYLGNKKALFYNLKEYYELTGGNLFKTVPLTFHIKKGLKDPQYKRFVAYYKKREAYIKRQQKQMQNGLQEKRKMRNIWIVKPGQLTNRGNGITVIDQIYELNSIIKSEGRHDDGTQKTFIVQLYIDRPLLYKKRKFDIRHFMLITHINGVMKGYWFDEGYIRTSGYEFDIEDLDRQIHLTNDAVQKYTGNYNRFEPGNKLSYAQFQKYLDSTYPKKKYSLKDQILPKMKQICLDSIKSSFLKLSPENLEHNFELLGMDFMIDSDFVPWLIQINTNPCLEITCALQQRLLPQLLDQTLRLTLDVIYPPPCHYPNTAKHLVPETNLSSMKFQLIFDERIDGQEIKKLYGKNKKSNLLDEIGQLQDDEVYEDEGQMVKIQDVLQ